MIRINDEPIAWEVDLLEKGFFGIHNLSFDQRWKKYSPGKQLMEINLRHAWRKIEPLIFCRNTDYKEKIASRVDPVYELHMFRRSIRGYLAKRLIEWNIRARKKIVLKVKTDQSQ